MGAFNSSIAPESDSRDHQMANLGVTDQQLSPVGQARGIFNVNAAGNVMINAGRSLAGTLAQETLKLRISEARKTFIQTESYKHVQRILDQFGHVTISGASGEGKTTMAHMLARDYIKQGYQIVFVEKVDAFDFNECISSAHRLVLIVDDVFGTVGLSTDISHLKILIRSIQTHMQKLKQISGNNQPQTGRQRAQHQKDKDKDQQDEQENQKDIRVVFTSKTYNFKDGISKLRYERLSMFTGHTLVDLTTDKDHSYSDEEKIAMYQNHKAINPEVKAENISQEDIINTDKTLFGFPITCRLLFEFAFSSVNMKDFFIHPLFYLRIEINDILSRKNDQAAALILMLLCEDKLDLAKLELQGRDKSMDELFQHVTAIVPFATRQGTATAARHFRGTFFSGGENLSFAHSSIYDACACAMYDCNPAFVLQYCSFRFLFERLKEGFGKEAKVSDHLNFLFLSDHYYDLFAARLVEAVVQNNFSKTLTHPVLKNRQFARILIQKLQDLSASKTEKGTDFLRLKDRGLGILYWIVQGYSDELIYEIEAIFHIKFTQEEIQEALVGCVEKDDLIQLKCLFSKVEKAKHRSLHRTLLLLTGENGSWKIAQYLLTEATNLQVSDENKRNLIHLTCLFERTDMLKSFISQIDSLVTREDFLSAITSVDIDGHTPALLAAASGSWHCFKLLRCDSDLDVLDINRCGIIHFAAVHGNIDIVQSVLTPSNINNIGMHGWTPVLVAAVHGNFNVFELLVASNADLTLKDDYGDSVLHLACRGGNKDIVQHVLKPSEINNRGRNGLTAVMNAAVNGHFSVFDFLVSNDADLTLMDNDGYSVLHQACQGGNRDIVQHVLNLFNLNSKGGHGMTPVMIAAQTGNLSVFDLLISNNADLTLVSNNCDSVVHLACHGGNRDLLQYVLTSSNINDREIHGCTPVMKAAASGHICVFDFLLLNHADITLVNNYGESVLHEACKGGNRDIVKHVLTNSNINSRGDYGWTPVMIAAVCGHLSVFDFLVSNNADLTLMDNDGDSVLHLACQGGNIYIVKCVLTTSNINSRGMHGWTPVMKAAVKGHLCVFEYLVSNNAGLTLIDNDGDSVLHLACQGGSRYIVQHVLTPSNINSRGIHCWTAVMKAAVIGCRSVFDFLVSNNADLTLVSNNGDSILTLACRGGNRYIVKHVLTPFYINSKGQHCWTPVMNAAVHGHLSVFDFLVSNNADITPVDNDCDSVLHLACQGGNRDIVQHVMTLSNINSRGMHDWTPVMNAAVHGHLSVFDYLKSNNADLTLVSNNGDSILHLACQGGNRDIVQHVLTPSNMNSTDMNGRTPVMKAAVYGHLSVFDFLVSNKADLTLMDNNGNSVLHLACKGGNRDIVHHVLTPSNINSRGKHGSTPLMYAAVSGNCTVFDYLVSNNADLTLMMSNNGDNLLHFACRGGNRDIVEHVLTSSNINNRGIQGLTPVMYAAVNGNLRLFDYLVSNHADLTLVDNYGDSMLHLACRGGNKDIAQHVLTPSNINSRGRHDLTPVMKTIFNCHLRVFKFLVSNNADLTLVDSYDDSILHLACQRGNIDIVEHVLTTSNINKRGIHGWTSVMIASVRGHLCVFNYLVSNNADLTLVSNSGDSVLHLACKGGNRDIVKHVLTPSNINSRGRHGWTPVMKAAVNGQLSAFDFLVSNKVDLTLVSNSGDSVLHLACKGGNRDIVKHVLIPFNINSRGRHGWTPVMKAAVNGQLSVFDFLVSNKVDLTLVSSSGDSVLHLACKGGNRDIVKHVLTPFNINNRGRHGWTPVMKAAVNGNLSVFDLLISNNADLTQVSNSGDSLPILACRGGNRHIVQHVLTSSNKWKQFMAHFGCMGKF